MADPASTPKPVNRAAPSAAPSVVAAAPAAPAPLPGLSTNRAQTLRQAQIRRISTERVKEVGHFYLPMQIKLPPEWDFADVLNPEAWSSIAPGLQASAVNGVLTDRLGTTFDVYVEDNAFYGQIIVHGLRRNKEGNADALYVTCIGPLTDPETGKGCPVDVKTGGVWHGRPAKAQAA